MGGARLSKADRRIEVLGDLDELTSWLGRCCSQAVVGSSPAVGERLQPQLRQIQADLLALGAQLAQSRADSPRGVGPGHESVARLERWIDEFDSQLPPLHHFVLPGGTLLAADIQVARTVCRRAERALVRLLQAAAELGPGAASPPLTASQLPPGGEGPAPTASSTAYLNRLSDYLFTAGRWVNQQEGVAEPQWLGGG